MLMTSEEAFAHVRPHLSPARYTHTLGVHEVSITLAKRYGADVQKCELAAILHDICKEHDVRDMRQTVTEVLKEPHWAQYGDELLHAPCGAHYVQHHLGICDNDILAAIKSHTTGRAHMSIVEKVVFVADYIEPNRAFPGVEKARLLAEESLDSACLYALQQTMTFLLQKEVPIHPETVCAYHAFLKRKGRSTIE
ncbi:bis(5'-nucleosyl)-tetraphosphatase (symmetrical) YqeK [Shouchella lonarensis]|uniref:bis(5'-nucleosyl)-tetraphosphatase (symmetrical) n=1 Tax=Shouchella lonarensis TaxID=1464122 RepID=A0A1G6KH09_9BACI|nr:putative HD superfamily hydrolase of NAD metabolism [Shouchella lonarensis]